MSYIQGFVMAVPTENRDAFVEHATKMAALMAEFGATRIVDAWGEDVPAGKVTDFRGAVDARTGETVCFGWMEFADAAARDACFDRMMSDPRMQALGEAPFDGKRMIFAGFEPMMDEGAATGAGYVEGFVVPVPRDNRDAYHRMALATWPVFRDHGCLRHVESWGADVPEGKVTDFFRAVKAEAGEEIVFAFLVWPDKPTRDDGVKAMKADPRMAAIASELPFDGQRMIVGGFSILPTR